MPATTNNNCHPPTITPAQNPSTLFQPGSTATPATILPYQPSLPQEEVPFPSNDESDTSGEEERQETTAQLKE